MRSRPAVFVVMAICCCTLAGCLAWSEDQNGNLKSVGLPGIPVWQAKKPGPPQGATDTGLTPDQASQVSGPVLVVPPDQPDQVAHYHYYPTGQNNCQQDLAKAAGRQGRRQLHRRLAVLHRNSAYTYVEGNGLRLLMTTYLERVARKSY